MESRGARPLFFVTIVLSATLLFSIQPVMAKAILPQFGGSAGVWVTAMMFFQTILLAGYFYAWVITRWLPPRLQKVVHGALLLLSLLSLPIHPHLGALGARPTLSVLAVLAVSIGLPYLTLSATTPLLQSWFTGTLPYRLFAVSNAGSLLALLAYPFVIEPLLSTNTQFRIWSVGYAIFFITAGCVAFFSTDQRESAPAPDRASRPAILWITLAACASALWMAVANHLSQQVAAVPFVWVLLLSIYLLTFILCFEGRRNWYGRKVFRFLLPIAWVAGSYALANAGNASLLSEISIFAGALFVWCMFCHGELARSKPEGRRELTFFYLMLALGGALGGIFVAVVAPNVFSTSLELPIGIVVSVMLGLVLVYSIRSRARLLRIGLLALGAFIVATRFEIGAGDVIHLRNFYGAIQVKDTDGYRSLYNGKTLHGVEFLAAERLLQPTTYYGPESGVGRILAAGGSDRRVALVGLGAGTLASYARPGDQFRFYEIDPDVVRIAAQDFHFLSASAGHNDVLTGDGRLLLEQEPAHSFDVIVLDAFADDSIPVHLLTREAFAMYFRGLKPGGVIAIHITNRFLDLRPVVTALAASFQKRAEVVHSPAQPAEQIFVADWMLVYGHDPDARVSGPVWTDNYSNLFGLLRY